ncbi:MAG: polysaccharide biosynthesis/export family protein [Thermodesulfobacteriota bacterium]|nr:polysaccharide biosynthesis/export family protein [Thermodesulfobacteriota bacterium]
MERLKAISPVLAFMFLFIFYSFAFSEDGYRLGPDDVITITIFAGGKVQNKATLTVSSLGVVSVPFLGEITCKDRTIDEITKIIKEGLAKDYFVEPLVNIKVEEYRSKKVYILGEVKNPGLYELKGDMALLYLISKAGGINGTEAGNFAILLKGQGESVKNYPIEKLIEKGNSERIDLRRLFEGDPEVNVKISDSDLVYIPSKKGASISLSKIYVMGRVKNPKAYDFQKGITALNACIIAGGFDPFAAPNRATITRIESGNKKIIKINLNKVRDGKEKDILLKPGDRIYIPETRF